ncbi:XRE family transcriptional regulator [Stenotrophomonas maltophilia]|jgi:transcriptional regulator with XRE-family HTH domain|uniref:helix-turn-helix domain-containing protein n=1 Tax=Stenotrophomonas maltophilia TaxID=40324 RepID=UPI00131351D3|nr:helix-turn-helix transcriptional regulator [Stenotrophomonas maltophilia]MBA0395565.1 XRE family transcriptional regulator [Stenotrophomonas maltophilia]
MTDGPDTHRSALAGRLREARKAAGLSQGQVAKLLQMHRPTVSEIEAGNRRVSAEELTKFAETYDVTVSWLLGETAEQLEMNDPRLQLAARELSKLKPDDLDRLLRLLASMRSSDAEEGGMSK